MGDDVTPAHRECGAAYSRLRAIATAALAAVQDLPMHEIEGFDSSLHMDPEGDWKPEVELTIQLTHTRAYMEPPRPGPAARPPAPGRAADATRGRPSSP